MIVDLLPAHKLHHCVISGETIADNLIIFMSPGTKSQVFTITSAYDIRIKRLLSKHCFLTEPMTQLELTQCLHLAKTLDLIVSSRMINGVLYVYNAAGQKRPWDSFLSDYPLERLQAMIDRRQARPTAS